MTETLLTRIDELIAAAGDMESLACQTIALLSQVIDADRRSLFVLDRSTMSLRSLVAEGVQSSIVVPLRIGVIGSAILQRAAMRVGDAYGHPYFSPEIDASLGFRTRSLLVAPMLGESGGLALGGFELINKVSGEFTDDDEVKLVAAAARVARWIEDGSIYPAGVEAEAIAMRNVIGAERASVFALEQRTSRLIALFADGDDGRVLSLNMRLGIAGLVAITGGSVVLDDAWSDARFDRSVDTRTGYRTRSLLSAATTDEGGRTNGVIQLINRRDGSFTATDRLLVEGTAKRIGPAIARLYRQP